MSCCLFSFRSDFLLVGLNPVAKRFKDARAKSIEIVNLVRLNGLLKGQLTFDRLDKLDELDSEEFMGNAYQPATNASVAFGDAKPSAAAKKEAVSKKPATVKKEETERKPTAVNTDEIPPLESDSDPMEEDSKPAAVPSSGAAAAATSQALVPRSDSSGESTDAMVPASGKKQRFVMPKPGKNGAIANVFGGQRFVLTGVVSRSLYFGRCLASLKRSYLLFFAPVSRGWWWHWIDAGKGQNDEPDRELWRASDWVCVRKDQLFGGWQSPWCFQGQQSNSKEYPIG